MGLNLNVRLKLLCALTSDFLKLYVILFVLFTYMWPFSINFAIRFTLRTFKHFITVGMINHYTYTMGEHSNYQKIPDTFVLITGSESTLKTARKYMIDAHFTLRSIIMTMTLSGKIVLTPHVLSMLLITETSTQVAYTI